MPQPSRLNNVIGLLEQGKVAITAFMPPAVESAIEFATSAYDGVVIEAEHNPYDIRQLRDCLQYILKGVPGIGVVLIGEGDLSQNLGFPRQYDHPAVVEAMTAVRRICAEHRVVCGHPHVDIQNAQRVVDEGYRFLMPAPARTFAGL